MIGQQEQADAVDVEFEKEPEEKIPPPAPSDSFIFTLRFNAVDGGAILERAGTLPGSSTVFVRKAIVAGEEGSRRLSLGVFRKSKQLLVEHLTEAMKND